MAKSRLKRKLWVLSFGLVVISIMIMITTPSIYFKVLPIIIPSSILTVTLPCYMLDDKNTNDLISINEKDKKKETNEEINQNIIEKEKIKTNSIIKERENNAGLEIQYQEDKYEEEKPKVKTKGAIH